MKIKNLVLIIAVIVIVILVGVFSSNYGKNAQDRKVNKMKKNYPVVEISYDTTGGNFNLIPPPGHFINIDTINMKIVVVDSAWLEPIK